MFDAPHIVSRPIEAQRRPRRRRKRTTVPLWLEAMEERLLPSAVLLGFDANARPANDDGSSSVPLGFTINFYGSSASSLFVNDNGNVTFGAPYSTFTPYDLGSPDRPALIAPFFADVDTRASGQVTYGAGAVGGHNAFGITWRNVGYFDQHGDKTDTFQLVFIDRADTGAGNFDIEFNYDHLAWETGDSSGGSLGRGGHSARAGFTAGSGDEGTFFELAGSGVPGALLDSSSSGLVTRSLGSSEPGRFVFQARGGRISAPLPAADAFTVGVGQSIDVPAASGLLANDSDALGLGLNIAAINASGQAGSHTTTAFGGDLLVNADGSFSYTPAAGFHGVDTFTYTLTGAAPTPVAITVNSPPAAADDSFQVAPGHGLHATVLDNDVDFEPLTVSQVGGDGASVGQSMTTAFGGSLTVHADGTFDYTPAAGFRGVDRFSYTVQDSFGASATATVAITVPDTAPSAGDDDFEAVVGETSIINVLGNDDDPDADDSLGVVQVNGATALIGQPLPTAGGGILTLNADGSFSYTAPEHPGDDSFTYTAFDGHAGGYSSATVRLSIRPGQATRFILSAPTARAGDALTIGVQAVDQFSNPTSFYGLVHLSDLQEALAADTILVNGAGSFSVTLHQARPQTLTASAGTLTGSIDVTVQPARAARFILSVPRAAVAGDPFVVTLQAQDADGNPTTYSDVIHLSGSVDGAVLSSNGLGSFTISLRTATSQTITATGADGVTGISGSITISPAAADHFAVVAPATATAGVPFDVEVTAYDRFDNVATGYSGVLHFASSDGHAVLPASGTLAAGHGDFSATLRADGPQSITVSDTADDALQGTSNAVAAQPVRFSVDGPATVEAGSSATFKVQALDASGNNIPSYVLALARSDDRGTLSDAVVGSDGVATFTVSFEKAGAKTLTIADAVNDSIAAEVALTVTPAAVARLSIDGPTSAVAGAANTYTVKAFDRFDNLLPSYLPSVSSDSDGELTSPEPHAADTSFTARFKVAGDHRLTVTDPATGIKTELVLAIRPAAVDHVSIEGPGNAVAGSTVSYTVKAFDRFDNPAPASIQVSSSDQGAIAPGVYSVAVGGLTIQARFTIAGSKSVSINDGAGHSASQTVTVDAASATHFQVSAPTSVHKRETFTVTVTALDPFGNIDTSYRSVSLASSDPAFSYTVTAPQAGRFAFNVTMRSGGSQTLTMTGNSGVKVAAPITVLNAAPSSLSVNVDSGTIDPGGSVALTGSFADADLGDSHTVSIDWGDGSTPTTVTLTAGLLSFSEAHQYQVAGAFVPVVTVTDSDGAAASSSTNVQVVAPPVQYVAPSISSVTLAPDVVQIGQTLSVKGSIKGSAGFGLVGTINFGDGSADVPLSLASDGSFNVPHVYNGETAYTVTVTARDSRQSVSASFTVNVLFAGIGDFDLKSVAPGSSVTAQIATASATLHHSASATDPAQLLVAAVPNGVARGVILSGADPSLNRAYDLRAIGTADEDSAVVVFRYELVGGDIPTLMFLDPVTGELRPIQGSTLVPNSYIIDTVQQTITVIFDRSSFPVLGHLNHTLFTVAVAPSASLNVAPASGPALTTFNGPISSGNLAAALALVVTGTTSGLSDNIAFVQESEAESAANSFVVLAPTVTLSPSQVGALDNNPILPVGFDPETHPPTPGDGIVPVPFSEESSSLVPALAPEAPPTPAPGPEMLDELSFLEVDDVFLQSVAPELSQGRAPAPWVPDVDAAVAGSRQGTIAAAAGLLLGLPVLAFGGAPRRLPEDDEAEEQRASVRR